MRRLRGTLKRHGAVLNVAVAAQALLDGETVPLQRVWPGGVEELKRGAGEGAIEPVCHGLLHLDPHALAQGRLEFREFANLGESEAGSRIAAAAAWQAEAIGPPATFVAPAWAYGEHGQAAAADLGLASWLPPEPGPLLGTMELRETLADGLPGLCGLDYRPLAALAALGLPPTVVMHGALLDHRLRDLGLPGDATTLVRLALRRDVLRLPGLAGIRWLGARGYLEALRAHSETTPDAESPPDSSPARLTRSA
jgi:hypothetical protein